MFGPNHPEWLDYSTRIKARIETLAGELESVALDLDRTNFVRGQIAALRSVIKEESPTPPLSVAVAQTY